MAESEKTCPDCAETVKSAARVCRFCGYRFEPAQPSGPGSEANESGNIEADSRSQPQPDQTRSRGFGSSRSGVSSGHGPKVPPVGAKAETPPRTSSGHGEGRQPDPEATKAQASAGEPNPFFAENRVAIIVLIALTIVVVIGSLLIFRDRPVEPRLAGGDGGLDRGLTLGGLASAGLPESVAIGSLRSHKPEGFELMAQATERDVIESFKEAPTFGRLESRFLLDGGFKEISFTRNGMQIEPVNLSKGQSDKLFLLGLSNYEYEGGAGEFGDLATRLDNLTSMIPDTVTIGTSYPDAVAEANALISDWNGWLERNRRFILPDTRRISRASIALAEATAALGSSVTQSNLDSFNAALEDLQRAAE